jgi:TonB family protein
MFLKFTIFLALTLCACDRETRPAGASVEQRQPQSVVPSPSGPYTHPIFRFAPRVRADDPLRNPSVAPVRISGEEPKYSEEARRARVQGVVLLEIIIEADGRVSGGRVLKPLPFGLTEAAIESVRTWRYKPGREGGRAVRTVKNESVVFKLP